MTAFSLPADDGFDWNRLPPREEHSIAVWQDSDGFWCVVRRSRSGNFVLHRHQDRDQACTIAKAESMRRAA